MRLIRVVAPFLTVIPCLVVLGLFRGSKIRGILRGKIRGNWVVIDIQGQRPLYSHCIASYLCDCTELWTSGVYDTTIQSLYSQ